MHDVGVSFGVLYANDRRLTKSGNFSFGEADEFSSGLR